MREIKFRLRVGKNIVGYEKFYPGHVRSDGLRDSKAQWLYSKEGSYWNSEYIYHDQKDQFTGLHDKNGKEIYEGDILQLHCGSEDGVVEAAKIKAEVKWHDIGFKVEIPDKVVRVNGGSKDGEMVSWREIHTWVGMHTCLLEWTSKLEVIGNIYQNPELLNNPS